LKPPQTPGELAEFERQIRNRVISECQECLKRAVATFEQQAARAKRAGGEDILAEITGKLARAYRDAAMLLNDLRQDEFPPVRRRHPAQAADETERLRERVRELEGRVRELESQVEAYALGEDV
jgi:hypothetical protein